MTKYKPFFEGKIYPDQYAEKLTTLLMKASKDRSYGQVKGFFSKLWHSNNIGPDFYEALTEVLFNNDDLKFDDLKNRLLPFCDYPPSTLDDIIQFLLDRG